MACFHPIDAWQLVDGSVVFAEKGDILRPLTLPCGRCIGCRLERSRQWAVRCVHESQMHEVNCFITLTYDDDHLPVDESLNYGDFQLFMKRLRKLHSSANSNFIKFYMAGEYGDINRRPHYHACLFGVDFPDRVLHSDSASGFKVFRSEILEKLWPFGYSSVCDFSFDTAAYVARYVMKKITGDPAEDHYRHITRYGEVVNLVPEFNRMSLKPGIGAKFFEKFRTDMYPRDEVVINGAVAKPPRYYDKLLEKRSYVDKEKLDFKRYQKGFDNRDSTPSRLAVRETVTKARLKFKKRQLEY